MPTGLAHPGHKMTSVLSRTMIKGKYILFFSLSYAFIRFSNSGLHLLQIDDSLGMQSNQRQESDQSYVWLILLGHTPCSLSGRRDCILLRRSADFVFLLCSVMISGACITQLMCSIGGMNRLLQPSRLISYDRLMETTWLCWHSWLPILPNRY